MSDKEYLAFLERKQRIDVPSGLRDVQVRNKQLFEFQRDVVRWALQRGRAAIWADCGLGKTAMQLEWARQIVQATGKRAIILVPLAVAPQTVAEASKFKVPGVVYARSQEAAGDASIVVTNYEMLQHFDPAAFHGVVLDESSILKAYDGKTRNQIITAFAKTPFRLACTATPAPNDYEELGNHAEFLGVMTRSEMLGCFFVHDGARTSQWRLKGHAQSEFWRWVCSWAVMIRRPSDLGYNDEGYVLPRLTYREHIVPANVPGKAAGWQAQTLSERREARKSSLATRVAKAAELVNGSREPWIVWCDLNAEGDALTESIPRGVQVAGGDSPEDKEARLGGFAEAPRNANVLISKPSIAGFGLNWQHCARVAFVGLSDSYEAMYQAVRRCWRFGQQRPVEVHVIVSDAEGAVVENIKRKEAEAAAMAEELVKHMAEINRRDLKGSKRTVAKYERRTEKSERWECVLGDAVEVVSEMADNSVDFSVFSPPFASLYTYSNSDRDMGNCKNHEEFFEHFKFLVAQLERVTKTGRLAAFHCMQLPTSKARDGVIGLTDFRGLLLKAFQDAGWVFHSEVCIWKDPVMAVQRTKALGLLYKQLRKDSSMSRQGIPDYLVIVRKRGVNAEPIEHTFDEFPVSQWQKWASPVWLDVNPSDTLQRTSARAEKDEKHICPLQLSVIERAIRLWSNPGDLVLSPFAGIGSEGVVALRTGRRFLGVELKDSYFKQAVANLRAEESAPQSDPRVIPTEDGLADAKVRAPKGEEAVEDDDEADESDEDTTEAAPPTRRPKVESKPAAAGATPPKPTPMRMGAKPAATSTAPATTTKTAANQPRAVGGWGFSGRR